MSFPVSILIPFLCSLLVVGVASAWPNPWSPDPFAQATQTIAQIIFAVAAIVVVWIVYGIVIALRVS